MSLSRADLLAVSDVFRQLADEADDLSTEDTIHLWEALGLVLADGRTALQMLETAIKFRLEQPMIVDGKEYSRQHKGQMRYDHTAIARRIIDEVRVDLDTGEIRDTSAAVEAIRMFVDIYLSASSTAKRGALKALLGVHDPSKAGLAEWELTGSRIDVTTVEE